MALVGRGIGSLNATGCLWNWYELIKELKLFEFRCAALTSLCGCGGIHAFILAHKRFIVNSTYAYLIYHDMHKHEVYCH